MFSCFCPSALHELGSDRGGRETLSYRTRHRWPKAIFKLYRQTLPVREKPSTRMSVITIFACVCRHCGY